MLNIKVDFMINCVGIFLLFKNFSFMVKFIDKYIYTKLWNLRYFNITSLIIKKLGLSKIDTR